LVWVHKRMPRSLQDVLRAGAERSRANAPREIQTRLEREEEMREEHRRIVHAKDFPEMGREAKHAWNRLWEETKNEADMHQGARDCFAEREDLWTRVEGMEALRETSHIYKQMYEDLLERHEQIVDRLMHSQNQEKLKERIFGNNANEARVKGDTEAALDFEKRRIMARNEVQMYNYIMHGSPFLPPEHDAAQAGGRLDRLMGMWRNLERTQAEARLYQLEANEARQMGQVERERTSEAKLRDAQAKANTLQRFIKDAEDREMDDEALARGNAASDLQDV
jgi:hypothetical protein